MEARRIKQNFMADLREAPQTLLDICMAGLENLPAWAEVLLFVDQFEELLTLSNSDDTAAFAVMLDAIAKSERLRAVVTMRHGFFNKAVENQTLAELLRTDAVFSLAIPKRDALRQMIERPAERAGLTFDNDTYYVGHQHSKARVGVMLDAEKRIFYVLHKGQMIRELEIADLIGKLMPFQEYLKPMLEEARTLKTK
ncbi:MAG: hypothetical protein OHK0046_43030 [Anaerolineae bacterium]